MRRMTCINEQLRKLAVELVRWYQQSRAGYYSIDHQHCCDISPRFRCFSSCQDGSWIHHDPVWRDKTV